MSPKGKRVAGAAKVGGDEHAIMQSRKAMEDDGKTRSIKKRRLNSFGWLASLWRPSKIMMRDSSSVLSRCSRANLAGKRDCVHIPDGHQTSWTEDIM